MEKYVCNGGNGLWYELQGDYYIPCLTMGETEKQPIGMRGRRHLRYLKEHRPVLYTTLILSCKLNSCLVDMDNLAKEMYESLLKQLDEAEGITDLLKVQNPMA